MATTKSGPATLPDGIIAALSLDIDGGTATVPLSQRVFNTGSVGFSGSFKVQGADGRRYQCSMNAVLVGSKPTA